jgi:hypothetical protein
MAFKHMLFATALTSCLPALSLAHDMAKGPNGGPVVEAAGHHVEFVDEGAALAFFLSDEAGKPIQSKGAQGRAVIQDRGKTETVPLASADPNKLTGNVPQPLGAGARIVLSATLSGGHSIQVRFVKN